jgi:hypothetical protein
MNLCQGITHAPTTQTLLTAIYGEVWLWLMREIWILTGISSTLDTAETKHKLFSMPFTLDPETLLLIHGKMFNMYTQKKDLHLPWEESSIQVFPDIISTLNCGILDKIIWVID